ncbi:MAG TPA: glycosyltransferase family 39 protein [Myxococcales bacterium]|nr:glycosyltransferase family 39 protein [Myxococcales bacterium]
MNRAPRVALALVLSISAALVVAPWKGHVDDVDAQVYQVVARNMVADGTWFDLRYLPNVWPRFREHLPFAFWPAAATMRVLGERAVDWMYALFTLATVWVTARIASRLAGPWSGVAAALALGTCESFWQYGGRLLLEPPLLLFATVSAGAALEPRPSWGRAALFGALAMLIKGPFGLLPLACVVVGRAVTDRSWRHVVGGAVAGIAACAPAAMFLLVDRFARTGTWWSGYLEGRLIGWTTGSSAAGLALRWFPLRVVAGRFWPGLPAVAYGLWRARNDRGLRPVAIACVLAPVLLCVPARNWGNHTYVVFPLLAILAGAAVGPALERYLSLVGERAAIAALAIVALATWALSLAGVGRFVLQPPCVVSSEFAHPLAPVPPGTTVPVVSTSMEWLLIGELAAERRVSPVLLPTLPVSGDARVAIVREGEPVREPWRAVAAARGWLLVRR